MRSRGVKKHSKKGKKAHNIKFVIAGLITFLLIFTAFVLLAWPQQNIGGGQETILPTRIGEQVTTATVKTEVMTGPYKGMMAPDTVFRTVDGTTIRLSDLRGNYVVLWFMAVWCPSCASVGSIIKDHLQSIKYGDRVKVIVVDLWTEAVLKKTGLYGRPDAPSPEDAETLRSFITQWGDQRWYMVLDDGELLKLWKIAYVDTAFVINPDGVVRLRSDGPVTHTLLAAALPPL